MHTKVRTATILPSSWPICQKRWPDERPIHIAARDQLLHPLLAHHFFFEQGPEQKIVEITMMALRRTIRAEDEEATHMGACHCHQNALDAIRTHRHWPSLVGSSSTQNSVLSSHNSLDAGSVT